MRPMPDAPLVALDIDGMLGDYHGHFIRFAEQWLGRELPDPYAVTGGVKLHQYLHMSRRTYNECKLAYRQGGLKRSMPCYDGSSDLTHYIRERGVQVWICTTRPYLRLDNIDPDTRHWLRRNRIQYDGVIYGEHKYRDLVRIVGRERVLFVADDLPELCQQAVGLGLVAVLRTQPYNDYYRSGDVVRASSMETIRIFFDHVMSERAGK